MPDSTLPPGHHAGVYCLSSGRPLASRVCGELGISLGNLEERAFEDGEHKLRPLESVRGRDVYVVESLHGEAGLSVNDKLVRVSFFIATLRDLGARRVTLVAPYLCYMRKDQRTKPRDPVATRYVAALLEAMGTHRVVSIDVHNAAAYENAFRIPAEHLTAIPTFAQTFASMVGASEVVVVSPDAGGVKRAERLRQALERRLARPVPMAFLEKLRSEGKVRGGRVVGSVDNRIAIIVDDLVSSGTTLALAADACRQGGATAAYAAVTHGVFAQGASDIIERSSIERLFVVDTISRDRIDARILARVQVIGCSPLLAAAISRLHTDGSLTDLGQSPPPNG